MVTGPTPGAPLPPGSPYTPAPPYTAAPAAYGAPPTKGGRSNNVILALAAVVVALVVGLAYVWLSGGSDDNQAADEQPPTETIETSSTVVAPALAGGVPATVPIEGDTGDDPRIHPLSLSSGQTGTVVIDADGAFTPVVALLDPDGNELPSQGVTTGPRGAAVGITASDGGEHSLLVSGFTGSMNRYTITFQPDQTFVIPSQLAVGDCVDRLEGERWNAVSGFFVADCAQPHEGQIFEQAPGNTASGQPAQEQCHLARTQRVPIPGYVAWYAYWGDGLTCVVVNRTGGLLTDSVVTG